MLLALQLVLGLQLQVAQAVAAPAQASHVMSKHASGAPAHAEVAAGGMAHKAAAADVAAAVPAADVDATADVAPAAVHANIAPGQPACHQHSTPHDCCHASACQCHCVYTPGPIALPALVNTSTSIAVPSLAATQFVAPRIDEFLRPPIA